jgi:hypothetical protein
MTPDELAAEVRDRVAQREAWKAKHAAEIADWAAARAAEREARKEAWRAEHEHELAISAEVKAMEREERRTENLTKAREPRYDRHTIDMAASMGITPDEFLEWQRKRREEIAAIPSLEEQMRTVRVR